MLPSHPSHDEHDGLIAGRFEIVRMLGDGTFATVYEAIDCDLGRRVALKLFTSYTRASLGSALREARAMARVNHENVLAVHDIGEHRGTPFLAIEYAETDLKRWLERGTREPAEILHVFTEAGQGLAAAHEAGLVHHDFKPANVLLRRTGSVAVGDFGLARHLDTLDDERGALDEDACAFGTLRYICPERLLGLTGDERSDQFSFCVALWEALAGTEPFFGAGAQLRYDSILAGPQGQPRARPHIVRALRRGLSPEPSQRFENMSALLAAITRPPHSGALVLLRRSLQPALTAAMLAAVFVLGVGISREAPALEVNVSPTPELTASAAMDYAQDVVFDGESYGKTVKTLMHAMPSVRAADPDFQHDYLGRIEVLADLLAEAGAYSQSAAIYAAGINLCQHLGVDATRLFHKRSTVTVKAQAAMRKRALSRGK